MQCGAPANALRETSMSNIEMILTILVAVIAGAALVQLIILIALFVAARKGMKLAGQYATEMKEQVGPVLEHSKVVLQSTREVLQTTKDLIARLEPKLETAAANIAEVTRIASEEAKKFEESADEITDRVRRKVARVDAMTNEALNGVERVGHILNQAVTIPVRQVSGIMAAVKAVVETLRAPAPPRDRRPR